MHARLCSLAAAVALAAGAAPSLAQLRVGEWNVTNYGGAGARDAAFRTALYASFNGRQFAPDVLVGQEFLSQAGVTAFLANLNSAAGSPGDWAAGPFNNGADTDNAFFFRTSRVQFLGMTIVSVGSGSPNHPRDINRYDFRPVGYSGAAATIAAYSSHMKAGNTADDQARRLLEAQIIRANAASLPSGWNFLLAADLNIPSSAQSAYVELVGPQANNAGRFFDPILTPGSWNNSNAFRFVHTQDPAVTMDDRFDQILLSASLLDGLAFDYIGSLSIPYSTTTWNDPNHSYRAWGNDGSSFNNLLTVANNQMVGPTIAQALIDAANGLGHLPVFLDLRVPAQVASPTLIDFGTVSQNATAQATLTVTNAGNTTLWTVAGIANLRYTLAASAGFTAPGGTFTEAPGGGSNAHTISMSTASIGPKSGTITINSDSPDEPVRVVMVVGNVVAAACYANCDGSTTIPILNVNDFSCFLNLFASGDPRANCDGSTEIPVLNINDFGCFLNAYSVGCP
ncbi:MAG: choice-of-anchor D domain-containing protein [Phycisphaerae bacterium]|nr:choice-of-anchor D domain-containing protein [Phycisphaerae bacterium]